MILAICFTNFGPYHLARLRAKLAGGMVRIETVRGVGYRIIGT